MTEKKTGYGPDYAAKATEKKKKPARVIRNGSVKLSIWENATKTGPRHSVSVQRLYKDDDGKWQTTQSFNAGDMPNLTLACVAADLWIRSAQQLIQQGSSAA